MHMDEILRDPTLTALYRFEADGSDSGPNGYSLTEVGGPSYVAGKFGNCADLGNPNGGKYFSRASAICDFSQNFTAIATVFFAAQPATNGQEHIAYCYKTVSSTYYMLKWCYKDTSGVKSLLGGGAESNITLTVDKWYRIGVSKSSGTTSLYINGALLTTGAFPTGAGSNSMQYFGSDDAPGARLLNGKLDELAFFSEAKTAQWFRRDYSNFLGRLVLQEE